MANWLTGQLANRSATSDPKISGQLASEPVAY
jgi:hypothetical protein